MKKTPIIGMMVIAVAIAIIISTYGNSSTYVNFEQAEAEGKEVHVVGQLVKDAPQEYDPVKDPNYFTFFIQDNEGAEKKVVFIGAKPQDFDKSEQIVLTGSMVNGEFIASNILMKCPSKYTEDGSEMQEFSIQSKQTN